MKVIGCRGKSHYLLAESIDAALGRILHKETKLLSPLMGIQQILKWGYWEECSLPWPELEALLQECIEVNDHGVPLKRQ